MNGKCVFGLQCTMNMLRAIGSPISDEELTTPVVVMINRPNKYKN